MAPRRRFLSPRYLTHVARFEADLLLSSARTGRGIARAARGSRPLLAGPWCSEIGFELLYWIPFLRWVCARHGIPRERVIAVSRGGAEPWYRDVAGDYVDLLDYFSEQELKRWLKQRVEAFRTQKQMEADDFDREFLRRASGRLGAREPALLHPSLMYRRFMPFWQGRRTAELVLGSTRFGPLRIEPGATDADAPLAELPESYVAVKAYFTKPLPDTEENRLFLAELLSSLARRTEVVLLSSGLDIDDHSDYAAAASSVHSIGHLMDPRDNLAVQTRVIARARALFATYGGFSYLGPLLGVPTLSFHSNDNFKPTHVEVLHRLVRQLRADGHPASFVQARVAEFPLLELASGARSERAPVLD